MPNRMLEAYLARTPNPDLRTRFRYGDRSPECVKAQNDYMRDYMRTWREKDQRLVRKKDRLVG